MTTPDVTGALRTLVEAVGRHKVPQTKEDAAVQVLFTLGPAYENAKRLLDELADFTPPKPNTWCKIVCRKDGEPVLVTRDWDEDQDTEVVRLEMRKKFSMVITLGFDDAADKADKAFAALNSDVIDDVLRTRGVDSIVGVFDGAEGG